MGFFKAQGKSGKSKIVKNEEVIIFVSLMEWNSKARVLKAKRGKLLALRIAQNSTYLALKEKCLEKWRAFHCNLYQEDGTYELLYEDGQKAMFLPGYNEF